jgi:hypothetical protein
VKAGVLHNLPRTTFIENDSVASLDNPSSEPHRRHIVYDPAGRRFFVANQAMNRVEVYSALNPTLQTTIDAPAASSVDLSADGATLWAGTATEQMPCHQYRFFAGNVAIPGFRADTYPQHIFHSSD